MIDPAAEAKRFITLDEVVQALTDDDPHTRFFADESDGPRTEREGDMAARYTMMHCRLQELRPVVFRHPMAHLTHVARDMSDDLVTVAIGVMLNGGLHGHPANEVFDFLAHRTILWRRVDVALLLTRHGVRVPVAILPDLKPASAVPPGEESPDERARRRLAALRASGGDFVKHGDGWITTPPRGGKLAALERAERAAGRKQCDRSDIRADLQRAAAAE